MIRVQVASNGIRVSGLDPLQANDLCQDAPEPPAAGLGDLRATVSNLMYVWGKLPAAQWDDPLGKLMEARALQFVERTQDVEPGEYEKNWPFKQEPRPFQLKIFTRARHMTSIALAPVVMGAGKTKMLLDIAADKYMRDEIDCVAIIAAPRGVHRQWIEDAIPKSLTDAVKYYAAVWSPTRKTPDNVAAARMTRHDRVRYERHRLRFLAFNVEAFSTESGKAALALRQFMESGRCMLIEDESSRIKNPKAARTKAFIGVTRRGKLYPGLASLAAVRAIASGTPITKGIEDLWSQYEFLDPRIIGMSNYYAFQARYCVTRPAFRGAAFGAVEICGYKNTEEFVRKIAGVTFVVPKSALGLPEKAFEVLPVELTTEQRMIYNAIRNKLVDDLADRRITLPTNAAVRYLRLQQVLCGVVYEGAAIEEEPPVMRRIDSLRIKQLLEWRELNPGPTVIWCRFRQDVLDVRNALRGIKGYSPVMYYGETSDEDREMAKRAFRTGIATDFVGTAASAGMGVDGLQDVCEQAIYYSSTFSREHRWQSEDRIHRIGMKGNATYTDMVVPKSVDQMILDSYKTTEDLIKSIMSRPEMIPIL